MSEISKTLTVSTIHLSEKTRTILDAALHPSENLSTEERIVHDNIAVFPKLLYDKEPSTVGYFVYVPDLTKMPRLDFERLPKELSAALRFARIKDCSLICFDRDADMDDQLLLFVRTGMVA